MTRELKVYIEDILAKVRDDISELINEWDNNG